MRGTTWEPVPPTLDGATPTTTAPPETAPEPVRDETIAPAVPIRSTGEEPPRQVFEPSQTVEPPTPIEAPSKRRGLSLIIAWLLFVVAACGALGLFLYANDLKGQLNDTKASLAATQAQVSDLQGQVDSLEGNVATVEEQNAGLKGQVDGCQTSLRLIDHWLQEPGDITPAEARQMQQGVTDCYAGTLPGWW
jgi:uncharacterized protein HemX